MSITGLSPGLPSERSGKEISFGCAFGKLLISRFKVSAFKSETVPSFLRAFLTSSLQVQTRQRYRLLSSSAEPPSSVTDGPLSGTECCSGQHPCAVAHRFRPCAPVPPYSSATLRMASLPLLLQPSEPHGAPVMSAYRPSSLPRLPWTERAYRCCV